MLNATAAIAVALELHVAPDVIREGLGNFTGVDRRFEVRGWKRVITVVDDYGHHPTEIRATLAAATAGGLSQRSCALSAAPLYADVSFAGRFRARVSSGGPRACAGYLCGVGEADRGRHGGSAGGSHAAVRPSRAEYAGTIGRGGNDRAECEPGDMILTLGAGSVSQAGRKRFWRTLTSAQSEEQQCQARLSRITENGAGGCGSAWLLVGGMLVVVALGGRRSPRFLLQRSALQVGRSATTAGPASTIQGVVYANRARICPFSRRTSARSVFHMPLAERRRRLLAVDWVRRLHLARLAHRIAVRITERNPVAFAKLPIAGGTATVCR